MKAALWIASLSRWAPALAYIVTVAIVGVFVSRREAPTITATQALARSHRIVLSDLQAGGMKSLVGRYLKSAIEPGQPITSEMTADRAPPPQTDNALAVILSVPVKEAGPLKPGALAQICLGGAAYGTAGKIVDQNCDEQICQIIFQLPADAAQTLDQKQIKGAKLIAGSNRCDATPASSTSKSQDVK